MEYSDKQAICFWFLSSSLFHPTEQVGFMSINTIWKLFFSICFSMILSATFPFFAISRIRAFLSIFLYKIWFIELSSTTKTESDSQGRVSFWDFLGKLVDTLISFTSFLIMYAGKLKNYCSAISLFRLNIDTSPKFFAHLFARGKPRPAPWYNVE